MTYIEAINKLVNLVELDCGTSPRAEAVLKDFYHKKTLNFENLYNFDSYNFEAVMTLLQTIKNDDFFEVMKILSEIDFIKNNNDKIKSTKRTEIAIKNSKERADKTKKKILNLVTGMFADEYKKNNGEWHITRIADEAGVSRDSVRKYIKELSNDLE